LFLKGFLRKLPILILFHTTMGACCRENGLGPRWLVATTDLPGAPVWLRVPCLARLLLSWRRRCRAALPTSVCCARLLSPHCHWPLATGGVLRPECGVPDCARLSSARGAAAGGAACGRAGCAAGACHLQRAAATTARGH
jgi:hypothetical protein